MIEYTLQISIGLELDKLKISNGNEVKKQISTLKDLQKVYTPMDPKDPEGYKLFADPEG